MYTEFLSDWEIAALTKLCRDNLGICALDNDSLESLLEKLERCSHIRLTFRSPDPQ